MGQTKEFMDTQPPSDYLYNGEELYSLPGGRIVNKIQIKYNSGRHSIEITGNIENIEQTDDYVEITYITPVEL